MNILVIGGSGFVSGTLAKVALAQGHSVWTITRGHRSPPEDAIALTADRHDEAAFEKVIAKAGIRWDLVVDCIGYEPQDARQDIAVFRRRAKHLVFISTDFVFDPVQRKFPQNEDNLHFLKDGYGGKKRFCELEIVNADCGPMTWTILRPCHIYGPESLLGCLPMHGRDPRLIERLKAGESLKLVGGGHFLQQPIHARDLAELCLSCAENPKAYGQIYLTAGPDIIESRQYFRIVADVLSVKLKVEEVPVAEYLAEHPENSSFLCHRIYDLSKLREHGLKTPSTPIEQGLREQTMSLLRGT